MKSSDLVEFEIETQINSLIKKGIKPEFLLLGDLSYIALVNNCRHKMINIPNHGYILKKYKELDVVVNPEWSQAGEYKKENEFVRVVGSSKI